MKTKLIRLKNDCLKELQEIGIIDKVAANITWRIDTRAKKRLGVCEKKNKMTYTYHTIGISDWVLKSFSDKDIKNTIMHELLHTINGCNNHGYNWQRYAELVNEKLGYEISRLANVEKLCEKNNINYETFREQTRRYKIICKKCGKVFYQSRLGARTLIGYMNNNRRHIVCGGNEFTIIDLKNHKILCD